jgi:curli biogenesis system outer membrane secretion channel CsgG
MLSGSSKENNLGKARFETPGILVGMPAVHWGADNQTRLLSSELKLFSIFDGGEIMNRILAIAVAVLFLCSSCATVKKPEVEELPSRQPQVSKVLQEETPKRFLKRKVAIARFTNETKQGQIFFLENFNKEGDRMGKQAVDILSARLAATDKFILFERTDIEKIERELKMGGLPGLNIQADYLIIGSISEFGRKETGEVGIFSRTKKVNIRLIDIYTGQVIYSEEGGGEAFSEAGTVLGVGGRAGYDSTLTDKAISAAISKLTNNLVENLLERPWRSYILAFQNGNYIIAGGKSQGIKEGDFFGVYQRGNRVLNPQTTMYIELPGTLLGTIKVQNLVGKDPSNEICMCSVQSGTIPTAGFETIYIQELTK